MTIVYQSVTTLLFAFVLLSSCNIKKSNKSVNQELSRGYVTRFLSQTTISEEQESALDALDILQTNTDEVGRLYSTFPNIEQSCYPADSSFEISQSELLVFIQIYVSRHCQNMEVAMQSSLVEKAVLAQEQYVVFHCSEGEAPMIYEDGIPMQGIWVLPGILGRRDLILRW